MNNPYTYARISPGAIAGNFNAVKKALHRGTGIMAVVKSDAYGHGIVEVSKALRKAGVDALGVAFAEEGMLLRQSGIRLPLYVLSGIQPGEETLIMEHRLIPLVYDTGQIERLARAARRRHSRIDVHLKIDTGMGRLGFAYYDTAALERVADAAPSLNITGIATHVSDASGSSSFTHLQMQRFRNVKAYLESRLKRALMAHAANTDTLFCYPESHFDMVRPGISIYGYGRKGLTPAMQVFSRLISVKSLRKGFTISYGRTCRLKRDTRVGVVPVGYADGYPRMLSNKGFVGIRGERAYIMGRVTMNHIMIDIHSLRAHIGDTVLVMGKDRGLSIGADDIAALGSTISYEVLCRFGSGMRRVYGEP